MKVALAGLALLVWVSPARAHPLAPGLLEIRREARGALAGSSRVPRGEPPLLPEFVGCAPLELTGTAEDAGARVVRFRARCSAPPPYTLQVDAQSSRAAPLLVRYQDQTAWLEGGEIALEIGGPDVRPSPRSNLGLGFTHLLGGFDHILFLLGLVTLVASFRSLAILVSAFTLGHGLSLALASLVPASLEALGPLVEVGIALSLAVLALRIIREDERGLPPWSPRAAAGLVVGFGLLHGLGFAGAFAEVGQHDAWGLLTFNIGVELAQLLVVGIALVLRRVGTKLRSRHWRRAAVAQTVGIAASYLVLERVIALIT